MKGSRIKQDGDGRHGGGQDAASWAAGSRGREGSGEPPQMTHLKSDLPEGWGVSESYLAGEQPVCRS